jgi:AraC family transcriptional regulator
MFHPIDGGSFKHMNTVFEIPTVWNQLAEAMYLKDSLTAQVTLSEHPSSPFARVQSGEGLPEIARPIVREGNFIVALQLKAIPFIEQFFGRTKVSSGSYPIGGVSAIDLREEPAVLLPHPFDALVLYVTQSSLDEIAYAHGARRVEQLAWPLGHFDPVVYHLGKTLLCSLEQPHHTSKLVVDHVLHALNCHFVCAYGGVKLLPSQFRGGLSSLQKRRATELLEANLDGKISLHEVAEACDLSVGHFARAFRQTFRKPPYKWLIERRVDRARDLMTNSSLSLADIAIQSGFTDQSALNRTFKRLHGVAPGIWRRTTTRGPIPSGRRNGENVGLYQQLHA